MLSLSEIMHAYARASGKICQYLAVFQCARLSGLKCFKRICHQLEAIAIDACRQGVSADHTYQCWILPKSHQCVLLPGACGKPHRVHSRGHQHTVGGQSNLPIQARWAAGPQSNACVPLHGHAQHLVRPNSACPLFASSVTQSSSWDCSPRVRQA